MSRPFRKTFLFNLIIIGLICVVIYWLFFASLSRITRHGEELNVPVLEGKSLVQAMEVLGREGFNVDIDSSFDPAKKPLDIIAQQPEGGFKVKKGRTIFLTVNRTSAPQIKMPGLVNLSFRSAEMMLKSNKLVLGDTTLRPDLADGAVLSQVYKGEDIPAGTLIAQGSRIDLVIGDGLGQRAMQVPDITGMSYPEAVAVLSASNLNYTAVFDGVITDTGTAIIYIQAPLPYNDLKEPNKISEGDVVDFRVKQGGR
jgi:beta-lactam-binding protein with PASTA domain